MSVSLAWLALTQSDLAALLVIEGPTTAGSYTPTLRIVESLTAIGIGLKYGLGSSLADPHRSFSIPWKQLLPLFGVGIILAYVVSPTLVPTAFGGETSWLPVEAGLLAGAMLFAILAALLAQRLMADRLYYEAVACSAVAVGGTVAMTAALVFLAGTTGAATAQLGSYALWVACLSIALRRRRAQ